MCLPPVPIKITMYALSWNDTALWFRFWHQLPCYVWTFSFLDRGNLGNTQTQNSSFNHVMQTWCKQNGWHKPCKEAIIQSQIYPLYKDFIVQKRKTKFEQKHMEIHKRFPLRKKKKRKKKSCTNSEVVANKCAAGWSSSWATPASSSSSATPSSSASSPSSHWEYTDEWWSATSNFGWHVGYCRVVMGHTTLRPAEPINEYQLFSTSIQNPC